MSQQTLDLTSELLQGMRLSGVKYRRIETSRPFGVEFNSVPRQSAVSFCQPRPAAAKKMSNGKQFSLESGDAVFIPNSDAHAPALR